MANWSTLKAAIANVIKTNGNQEITGAVLQSTLNSIVNAVGQNATFAGIATPSTNPGTSDGPVFYLAFDKGKYVNFGNIELYNNQMYIIWNENNTWNSKEIESISNIYLKGTTKDRKVFGDDALYYNVLINGQGGTKKELNEIFKSIYISNKINKPYIERYFEGQFVIKDEENNSYSIPLSFDSSLNENLIVNAIVNNIQFIILYNPSKRINGGFYNSTYEKTKLSDDVFLKSNLKNMYDIESINNYIDNGNFIDYSYFKWKSKIYLSNTLSRRPHSWSNRIKKSMWRKSINSSI